MVCRIGRSIGTDCRCFGIAEKPQPFDFLVDGELLRTSIEQFLLTKGITAVSPSVNFSPFLLVTVFGKVGLTSEGDMHLLYWVNVFF